MCFRMRSVCGRNNTPEKAARIIGILNIFLGCLGLLSSVSSIFWLVVGSGGETVDLGNGRTLRVELEGWWIGMVGFGLVETVLRIVFGAVLVRGVSNRSPGMVLSTLVAGGLDILLTCVSCVLCVVAAAVSFAGKGMDVLEYLVPYDPKVLLQDLNEEEMETFSTIMNYAMGGAFAFSAFVVFIYISEYD